jgi:hypothetical protein
MTDQTGGGLTGHHDFFIPTGDGSAIVDPEFMAAVEAELAAQQARDDQRRAAMTSVEWEVEDTLADDVEAQLMADLAIIQTALKRRCLTWPSELRSAMSPTDDDYTQVIAAMDNTARLLELMDGAR